MIVHDCEQGGQDWKLLRIGLPTASNFHRIFGKKGEIVAKAETYLRELLVESLLGFVEGEDNDWMARGRQFEEQARAAYELEMDRDVRTVGFITNDDGTLGCSPDGLVDPDGGLELKVLGAKAHVWHLLNPGDLGDFAPQVYGCLWLCEREWWDWRAWHPALPMAKARVVRDDPYIAKLAASVGEFNDRLAEAKAKIAALGYVPPEGTNVPKTGAIYGADSERV